jgi:putative molybdopterin biosynthesis protein
VNQSSRAALEGLARGEAHLVGCHLRDETSGAANVPFIQDLVPFPCTVIAFAVWEEGLIVAPGNPKQLNRVEDLARADVRVANREVGSGSRALLDAELARLGVPSQYVRGYDISLPGHLAVAEAVSLGLADAGVAIRAAANALGLDFVPLRQERYDLVVPRVHLDHPGVLALLDALKRPSLRAQVEALGGYDVADMGTQRAA